MASGANTARAIDPGALLASTHRLQDGSRVRLRLTRPSDRAKIESFLDDLGADPGLMRRFAFYDPRERLTLAATMPADGHEEIVGLADVVLTSARDTGVAVRGDFQRRGLGGLLARAGESLASRRRRSA